MSFKIYNNSQFTKNSITGLNVSRDTLHDKLLSLYVASSTSVQTTSTIPILLPGMTITPTSGVSYLIIATGDAYTSQSDTTIEFSIYQNDIQIPNSVVYLGQDKITPWMIQTAIVSDGTPIEIRWKQLSGDLFCISTCEHRKLSLIYM